MRKKERKKILREKERKWGENERNGEKKMSRVNYYQYIFNSQKEKLNILAKMIKISKSGRRGPYTIIDH